MFTHNLMKRSVAVAGILGITALSGSQALASHQYRHDYGRHGRYHYSGKRHHYHPGHRVIHHHTYHSHVDFGDVFFPTLAGILVYKGIESAIESSRCDRPATVTVVSANTNDSILVHVPNRNGSYTPVTICKSGYGFVGPEGEYYDQFPTLEQLKIMYGK